MSWDWVWWGLLIWWVVWFWRKRDWIREEWVNKQAKRATKGDKKMLEQLRDEIEVMRKDRDEIRPPTNTVRGGRVMLPQDIERAWRSGDYDLARGALQKYAYGMVGAGVSEDDKQRFRQLMTEFALDDPLYRDIMTRLKPIVLSRPGILQSAIYAFFPEYDQETVRYVAYFGHEIGDIHRRKKGRSYELLPPGEVIDMPE